MATDGDDDDGAGDPSRLLSGAPDDSEEEDDEDAEAVFVGELKRFLHINDAGETVDGNEEPIEAGSDFVRAFLAGGSAVVGLFRSRKKLAFSHNTRKHQQQKTDKRSQMPAH